MMSIEIMFDQRQVVTHNESMCEARLSKIIYELLNKITNKTHKKILI